MDRDRGLEIALFSSDNPQLERSQLSLVFNALLADERIAPNHLKRGDSAKPGRPDELRNAFFAAGAEGDIVLYRQNPEIEYSWSFFGTRKPGCRLLGLVDFETFAGSQAEEVSSAIISLFERLTLS